jgi:hypothetical protein
VIETILRPTKPGRNLELPEPDFYGTATAHGSCGAANIPATVKANPKTNMLGRPPRELWPSGPWDPTRYQAVPDLALSAGCLVAAAPVLLEVAICLRD